MIIKLVRTDKFIDKEHNCHILNPYHLQCDILKAKNFTRMEIKTFTRMERSCDLGLLPFDPKFISVVLYYLASMNKIGKPYFDNYPTTQVIVSE